MGVIKQFVVTKEPDMKRVVKKIVTVKAPCTSEMAALMECFRRFASGEADTACAQQRQALALCANSQKKANTSQTKSQYYKELDKLGQAFQRSGY